MAATHNLTANPLKLLLYLFFPDYSKAVDTLFNRDYTLLKGVHMTRTFIQTKEFSSNWDRLGFNDYDLRRLELVYLSANNSTK